MSAKVGNVSFFGILRRKDNKATKPEPPQEQPATTSVEASPKGPVSEKPPEQPVRVPQPAPREETHKPTSILDVRLEQPDGEDTTLRSALFKAGTLDEVSNGDAAQDATPVPADKTLALQSDFDDVDKSPEEDLGIDGIEESYPATILIDTGEPTSTHEDPVEEDELELIDDEPESEAEPDIEAESDQEPDIQLEAEEEFHLKLEPDEPVLPQSEILYEVESVPDMPVLRLPESEYMERISAIPQFPSVEDFLGMEAQVRALGDFVRTCPTPARVLICGCPGCGKTSFMHLLREHLSTLPDPDPPDTAGSPIPWVWVNAWEYERLGGRYSIAAAVLSQVLETLASQCRTLDEAASQEAMVKEATERLTSALRAVASSPIASDDRDSATNQVAGATAVAEPASSRSELRPSLIDAVAEARKLVRLQLEIMGTDRLVVFVDDMERLEPVSRLRLANDMGTTLDCTGLVMVVAGDAAVEGTAGSGAGSASILDNNCELCYNISGQYTDFGRFVEHNLHVSGLDFSPETVAGTTLLLRYSVGRNPMEVKRIIHTLAVLDRLGAAFNPRQLRILTGLNCMERAFGGFYRSLLTEMMDDDHSENDRTGLWRLLQSPGTATAEPGEPPSVRRFLGVLRQVLGDGPELTASDQQDLELCLRLSASASRRVPDHLAGYDDTRQLVTNLCRNVVDALRKVCPDWPLAHNNWAHLDPNGEEYSYRLWHMNRSGSSLWGPDTLLYRITCRPQPVGAPGAVTIGLSYHGERLGKLGLEPSRLAELKKPAFLTDKEFSDPEQNLFGWTRMEKKCGEVDFSAEPSTVAEKAAAIALKLSRLIRAGREWSDQIVPEKVLQRGVESLPRKTEEESVEKAIDKAQEKLPKEAPVKAVDKQPGPDKPDKEFVRAKCPKCGHKQLEITRRLENGGMHLRCTNCRTTLTAKGHAA